MKQTWRLSRFKHGELIVSLLREAGAFLRRMLPSPKNS